MTCGDQDEVICVFSYAGEEPHALVTVVDYNSDGMIRDGWVTSRVGKLLDHCREASSQRGVKGGSEGKYAFRQIDAGQARHLLEARAHRDRRGGQPGGQRLVPLLPRVHPGQDQGAAALPRPHAGRPDGAAAAGLEQGPAGYARRRVPGLRRGRGPVRPRVGQPLRRPHHRLRVRQGLRAAAADEPDQGGDVPARWLPRKVMLSFAEQDAMPHVLAAWVRWAGRRRGLRRRPWWPRRSRPCSTR